MKMRDIAALALRLALALGFLSAVASRLGFWGTQSSGWDNFLNYTAQVNSFLPKSFIQTIATTSTRVETALGILLLIGFKTNLAAFSAALLTFVFGAAMTYSFGIKEPLDYSVFAFSTGAFQLATIHYKWSIDQLRIKKS
jgi:uncharacterized membrane protein YphA (DoxX/SURF4 family)